MDLEIWKIRFFCSWGISVNLAFETRGISVILACETGEFLLSTWPVKQDSFCQLGL